VTKFLELCFAGVALGAQYALVALGYVVIYRATSVINFAQGGFVMLGAYLAYDFHQTWGLPFYLAVVLAMVGGAIAGALVEVLILRRLLGRPPFVIIMVTIGLLILIEQLVPVVWGQDPLALGDPWGVRSVKLGDVALAVGDFWTLGIVAVVLIVFFVYFKYSRMGVAMRATASDQEAALAQGISAGLVIGVSWAIAGAVAALAGVMLAGGGGGVRLDIELVALAALPAIILGGLDSPVGAVVGGLVIGLAQSLASGYQPEYAPWLGSGFDLALPYIIMVVVLLVRPYGLFGQREVRRV
jgi:branched-chain amino acid transport system permease protein